MGNQLKCTTRLAGVVIGMFWLVLLVVFSSGLNRVSQLAVYSLLVAFVGFRRNHVMQWDDGYAATKALTFGAAINFGPIGGLVVGALSVFAQNMDRRTALYGRELVAKSLLASLTAAAAGFVHLKAGSIVPNHLLSQALAIVASSVVFVSAAALSNLLLYSRSGLASAVKRTASDQALSTDLAVGFGLAMTARFLYAASDIVPLLLALPVVYLARQWFGEPVPAETPASESDGELSDAYRSATHALVAAIDARDRFTRMHTTNVVLLAAALARKMGLGEDEIEGLETAALFHDIGKLWIPEHILLKPGKLDQKQFAKIQCHPALGQRIMDNVRFPWQIGAIVRSHHERWDGTGYPDHLRGENIPVGARILCLADVFDAMISKRLYRPSNDLQDTLRYIRSASGTHFDPAVVDALDRLIADDEMPDVYKPSRLKAVKVVDGGQDGGSAGDSEDDISSAGSEFVAVFEIAQTAGSSLDLDQVLHMLADKIKSMTCCSTCAVFLREPGGNKLQVAAVVGENEAFFQGATTMLGRGQTGMVAETGRGIIAGYDPRDLTNPALQKSKAKLTGWVTPTSVMVVPIVTEQDGVIGTINLYQVKASFSEEDLLLLNAVAPEVGKAIQKALLFKQTSESALTDVMTGLHNARYLSDHLDEELLNAQRIDRPVTIMCMDVDNFKMVNDVLGHQQGDRTLRDMAKVFCDQVREGDLVCRYAGDEFVIVLPGTNKMEALLTKRRIEVAVDSLPAYGAGDKQVRVGVSIGTATCPEDGRDAASLIAVADARMYETKRSRKGRSAAA